MYQRYVCRQYLRHFHNGEWQWDVLQQSQFLASFSKNHHGKRDGRYATISRQMYWQIFDFSLQKTYFYYPIHMLWLAWTFQTQNQPYWQLGTLVHTALKFCSKSKLQQELDCIRSILCDNGYSKEYHQHQYLQEILKFQEQSKEWLQNCYFQELSQISKTIEIKERPRLLTTSLDWQCVPQVWETKQICYKRMLQRRSTALCIINQENLTRNLQKSCAHHSIKHGRTSIRVPCYCRYMGRTSLRLQNKINQDISKPSAIIKNIPKFSQNGIVKKGSIHPSLHNVTQQLGLHLL